MANTWAPDSWQGFEARHLPSYPDAGALDAATASLATHPPLVFAGEARALKADLADVAEGRAFLLQGGDCAESFAEFHPNNIRDTFRSSPHFDACAEFCEKYDQAAFDPDYESEPLEFFEPMLRRVMARPINSMYAKVAEQA